jgi:hypothetical protein
MSSHEALTTERTTTTIYSVEVADGDDERVSLAPLTFEQAVGGLLATPPPERG